MSVATQITRIKGNIAASYEQAEAKGAEMPATLNSDNLPQCIASIPTSPTPPPPTGDIVVIIYTYDSAMAKYVDSVYTKASKGDTITLPAIADVAEANIDTAHYNPALTADGWSGDVEVVGGQFTIPEDYYEDEICFMAHYYAPELCIVYCDGSHSSSFKSGADSFIVSIFQPHEPEIVDIYTCAMLSNLVGPNSEFISSVFSYTKLDVVNCNQSIPFGNYSMYLNNLLLLKRVIRLSRLLHGSRTKLTRFVVGSTAIRRSNLYGCHAIINEMNGTFQNCSSLERLAIPHFTTASCIIFKNVFSATNITYLDISNLSTAGITTQSQFSDFFKGATLLMYIKMAEDNEETHLFDFAAGLTLDFSSNTHLGINSDGNDNGWVGHLFACLPQQSDTKIIKLSSDTYSLRTEDEWNTLQNQGYTITK